MVGAVVGALEGLVVGTLVGLRGKQAVMEERLGTSRMLPSPLLLPLPLPLQWRFVAQKQHYNSGMCCWLPHYI